MRPLRRKGQPDAISIEGARRRFLEVYAEEKSALLGRLFESVLPIYALSPNCDYIDLWSAVESDLPELRDALASWATEFLLTHSGKPADWAMATALHTLWKWSRSSRQFKCIRWHHASETLGEASEMAEEFPAGEPGCDDLNEQLAIRILIPVWDRPNNEGLKEFKRRFYAACEHAYEEHVRAAKEWTERPGIEEWAYFEGLAMWQAGHGLEEIHERLADGGLNVGGRDPEDPDYHSAISKGLKRAAALIQLDRRP